MTKKRIRNRYVEAKHSYNYQHKLGKTCPICDIPITDKATTCSKHRRQWERMQAGQDETARLRHRLGEAALSEGVPPRVWLHYCRRWTKRKWGTYERAQIQELIYVYRHR